IDPSFFIVPQVKKIFDLVFVGNMGYLPNIEAAEFIVAHIMPLLPLETTLLLAGARPDVRVQKLKSPKVHVSGWFEDIREAYASAKIFVAPLWSGTGQQNKILEAMALGLPCITTTLVNNAIHATNGVNILLADDVNTFSDKINDLLVSNDAILNIGRQAQIFVKQNYNWEDSVSNLTTIFANKVTKS
ncbi:MAG: glycosyltransferase, partial [Saprospiraceae bacterium]